MMTALRAFLPLLAAPLLVAAGSPPASTEATPASAAAQKADEGKANVKVCRKMPPPLGSRLASGRRICKTQAEWDMMDQDMTDALRESQRKPFTAG